MIILITGASHTGKTLFAQKLLEKYHYPNLSIDHLKMGLLRSQMIDVDIEDNDGLTQVLWPIVREMIKTVIENNQHMIIEGCYVPFDWKKDFEKDYLEQIEYICLCMSEDYIEKNFDVIRENGSVIENRIDESYFTLEMCKRENKFYLNGCLKYDLRYFLIDKKYPDLNQLL